MSYDIYATVEPGPGRFETSRGLGNMTSNVAAMWREASPEIDGLGDIDGKKARDVSGPLLRGLEYMFTQRRELEKLNPPNGWGSHPDAFRYYAEVARTARDHPCATFWVSR